MSRADELRDKGVELFHQYDYESAARTFQQAREAYAEAGQDDMVAEMKVNIGLVHRSLGETQQALEMMQEALNMFRDTEDELRQAQVLGNLGGVYSALDDKEKAELSYRQAASIFLDHGKNNMYADTMMALGTMQFKSGNISGGAVSFQLGLERKDNPTGTQKILKSLVNLINRINGTTLPDETASSNSAPSKSDS
jgi:tetratricopeptide (TPR) repeat protein